MAAVRAHATNTVKLTFSGPAKDDLLQVIQLNGTEIPDLYLEPEIVMTLTRGGTAKDTAQEGRKEIRTLLKFGEIPAQVWEAIISVEDQHFQDHKGLDPRGIARAQVFVHYVKELFEFERAFCRQYRYEFFSHQIR